MIFTLNHHLSLSFNKFSCMPNFECLLNFPKTNLDASKLDFPKTFQADKISLPNKSLTKIKTKKQIRFQFKPEHMKRIKPVFKTRPLLCYHHDLSFLNLRFYFLNTLKALHCCWSAVKNNKRVAFLGVEHDLLTGALDGCSKAWFKSKNFNRDTLPRTINSMPTLNLGRGLKSKHRQPKKSGHDFNGLLTTNAALLKKPSFAKQPHQGKQKTFSNLTLAGSEARYYALVAKRMAAHAGLSSFVTAQSSLALLANPDQSLKIASSHLSFLKSSHDLNWSCLNGRTSFGLKAPCAHFETRYLSATTNESFPLGLAKTRLRASDFRFGTTFKPGRILKNQFVSYAKAQQRQFSSVFGPSSQVKKAYQKKQRLKKSSLKKKMKQSSKRFGFEKFCFFSRYRKQACLKQGLERSLKLFPSVPYKPFYEFYLNRILFYDLFYFAKNPYFKQAELMFFTHPDKTLNMVNQAKSLRIPSIGIESALKGGKQRFKYASQRSTVTMPLLGNPDNCFFVLLLLRLFMRLNSRAGK